MTGTLSGLHDGGYRLIKAGILNRAGLSEKAIIELSQLKSLTERTYGQQALLPTPGVVLAKSS
jgi:hypothetical protein